MDKYDYVIAKPEIEEVFIEHGLHKYIDKWKSATGRWVYKYFKKPKVTASHLADDLLNGKRTGEGKVTKKGLTKITMNSKPKGAKYNKKKLAQIYTKKANRESTSRWNYFNKQFNKKLSDFEKEYAEAKKKMKNK